MTKERLRAYRYLKKETRRLEAQLEQLETSLFSPKAQRLTGMPHSPTKGNPMDDMVARHLELQTFYREKLAELKAEQLTVERAIAGLPEKHRTVLGYYYIDCITWEEVCVQASYSWKQVHRIHSEALEMLRKE
jgi:DNA-directed RNA polymerase specialized sigma24 family protein